MDHGSFPFIRSNHTVVLAVHTTICYILRVNSCTKHEYICSKIAPHTNKARISAGLRGGEPKGWGEPKTAQQRLRCVYGRTNRKMEGWDEVYSKKA